MFEHSVKVPRHYKVAANIFKKVSTEGGSIKTLLYDNKLRHFRHDVLFALITETVKHAADIDKIFESSGLITNEPRLDPWLAKVLTAELLFGKKALPGKSKPEQTIMSYREKFEKFTDDHPEDSKPEVVRRPRYVRINTNLLTTSDAIRAFQDEEYRFVRCTSGSYNDYLEQIKGLGEFDFTQDYHVKTVFVFPSGTRLHEHELYLENKIILQDKATTLAVHLLAPPSGSVVLDMCAAPGMKTTQLAAYIRNEGKIYAVERNEARYKFLCEFVERTGSKCVETINKDVLEIRRGDYDDVEYVLLDPSCSGSGMDLCVHNYIEEARLAKLTSLQEKFLKHAMNAFPNVKRIVYSTCSVFPEENERVVTNVVKTSRSKWRVQDVKELLKGQWNNFGSGMYGSMGTRCLYAKPDTDYTTGFFLAVLDRDQKDFERKANRDKEKSAEEGYDVNEGSEGTEVSKRKHKKNKTSDEINVETNDGEVDNEATKEVVNKKKHKKKRTSDEINAETDDGEVYNEGTKETVNKEKHKKNIPSDEYNNAEVDIDATKEVINKKKHKKNKTTDAFNAEADGEVYNGATKEGHNESSEGTEVGKKKHKKNKTSDENNPEIDDGEVDNETTKETANKKKHKKNKTSHEIDAETEDGEVDNEANKNKHKKRKVSNENGDYNQDEIVYGEIVTLEKNKKKRKDNSHNIDNVSEIPINTENNEGVRKKKKRKRECEETDEQYNDNILAESEIAINAKGDDVPKKKKKRKHKYQDNDENNENVVNESEITNKDDSCDIPKKKKKDKHKNDLFEVSLTDYHDNDEIFKEKKKKKKRDKVALEEA